MCSWTFIQTNTNRYKNTAVFLQHEFIQVHLCEVIKAACLNLWLITMRHNLPDSFLCILISMSRRIKLSYSLYISRRLAVRFCLRVKRLVRVPPIVNQQTCRVINQLRDFHFFMLFIANNTETSLQLCESMNISETQLWWAVIYLEHEVTMVSLCVLLVFDTKCWLEFLAFPISVVSLYLIVLKVAYNNGTLLLCV